MAEEVQALIGRLQAQMNRAVDVFSTREGTEISAHGCAMGGNLNDLLAHNAEHERMHYGQIADRRYALGLLQRDPRQRYLAEWYRERATLIASCLTCPTRLWTRNGRRSDHHPADRGACPLLG